jgi:biotin operon repressor
MGIVSLIWHCNGHWMHCNALDPLHWKRWQCWQCWQCIFCLCKERFKYIEFLKNSGMGILDLFRKKKNSYHVTNKRMHTMHGHVQDAFSTVHDNVTGLHTSFATLHADIAQQKEWLRYLHEHHLSLHDKHATHSESTKSEFSTLKSWVSFLHKGQQKQEKHLKGIQEQLAKTMQAYDDHLCELGKMLEKTHGVALEAHKKEPQIIREEVDHDVLKEAVMRDLDLDVHGIKVALKEELHEALVAILDERHTTQKEALRDVVGEIKGALEELDEKKEAAVIEPIKQEPMVSSVSEVREVVVPTASPLTNPEQKLLNLLINESDPLSYSKIGQLTGHSINTVRVNMNSLKKKGLIEESTLPSGVKLFSVTSREKVRTMYNLQVL